MFKTAERVSDLAKPQRQKQTCKDALAKTYIKEMPGKLQQE
jgi:hypothetical protein